MNTCEPFLALSAGGLATFQQHLYWAVPLFSNNLSRPSSTAWIFCRRILIASGTRSSGGYCPADSTLSARSTYNSSSRSTGIYSHMKWSRIRVSWTRSLNSGCLKTSLETVSFLGFLTTHCGCPFSSSSISMTPGAKHFLNFSWCSRGMGPRRMIWGRSRYDAVAGISRCQGSVSTTYRLGRIWRGPRHDLF